MRKNIVILLSTGKVDVTIRIMYATDTILTFVFPAGRFGGTRIGISFFFPVLALALMWQHGLLLAVLGTSILLFSVLAHELAHLMLARSAGGDHEEMNLWPLGGLNEPFVRGHLQQHVLTMMSAPLVNLLLALSCTVTLDSNQIGQLLNPLGEFSVAFGEPLSTTAWRLAFLSNWILFLANMVPVAPFDSGVLLKTYLSTRFAESESRDLMIRLGLVFGLLGMFAGFVFGSSGLVLCSAFVLVLHIHESYRWYESSVTTDPGFAYDFSSDDDDAASFAESWAEYNESPELDDDSSASVLGRWQDRREQERMQHEQEEREREAQQVDDILLKLHDGGRDALTPGELHFLNRVSIRYRNGKLHN